MNDNLQKVKHGEEKNMANPEFEGRKVLLITLVSYNEPILKIPPVEYVQPFKLKKNRK